jgi:ketosteroid isomerase-like protein
MPTTATPPVFTAKLSPQQQVALWLEEFAACVRAVDYDTAREMFDEDVVGFGTFARMLVGRENLIDGQWRNIWGCTRGFRFIDDETRIDVDSMGELAWVAAPWHSQGRDETGHWFDRHGRCTLVLRKRGGGRWLCVHSHYSRRPEPKSSAGGVTPA